MGWVHLTGDLVNGGSNFVTAVFVIVIVLRIGEFLDKH